MNSEELTGFITQRAGTAPTPAVAVAVVGVDGPVVLAVRGTANLTTGEPATADHWWDLASLTKVLVTLPEVTALVRTGKLDLDAPIASTWPAARGRAVAALTPRQLLSHSARLPAEADLWRYWPASRAELVDRLLDTQPEPRAPARYSDVGFLILGELVADIAGAPLDVLAARRGPLRFPPLPGPAVATEDCRWRGRIIQGAVHDENAYALGGVAGQAGAFGTLAGVSACAQDVLRDWTHDDLGLFVEQAHMGPDGDGTGGGKRYALGWWLPPTLGLGGSHPGPDSFGMSGFVGNRLWFEPRAGYAVVVLGNRIHPTRGDRAPFNTWCRGLLDGVRQRWPDCAPPAAP